MVETCMHALNIVGYFASMKIKLPYENNEKTATCIRVYTYLCYLSMGSVSISML